MEIVRIDSDWVEQVLLFMIVMSSTIVINVVIRKLIFVLKTKGGFMKGKTNNLFNTIKEAFKHTLIHTILHCLAHPILYL